MSNAVVEVRVPSRTTVGEEHRVLIGPDGTTTCTCPASAYRLTCWAQKKVKEQRMTEESTALVPMKVEPPKSILPSRSELSVIADIARSVVAARGHAVPAAIDSPAKAMAVMLAGHELGVRPMSALRHIAVVNGKTEPDGQLMAGIVAAREPDATLEVLELTDETCTVRLTRPSRGVKSEFTYTIADAKRAGLVKTGSNWDKYPKDMLRWAAVKRICRVGASDLINSVSSIEVESMGELLDVSVEDAHPAPRQIDVEAIPKDALYNAGDEATEPTVDTTTGEITEPEAPAAEAPPADVAEGEYTEAPVADEEPPLPGGPEAQAPTEEGAGLIAITRTQDWLASAARGARAKPEEVWQALGVPGPQGAAVMAIAADLDAYKQRWTNVQAWLAEHPDKSIGDLIAAVQARATAAVEA